MSSDSPRQTSFRWPDEGSTDVISVVIELSREISTVSTHCQPSAIVQLDRRELPNGLRSLEMHRYSVSDIALVEQVIATFLVALRDLSRGDTRQLLLDDTVPFAGGGVPNASRVTGKSVRRGHLLPGGSRLSRRKCSNFDLLGIPRGSLLRYRHK